MKSIGNKLADSDVIVANQQESVRDALNELKTKLEQTHDDEASKQHLNERLGELAEERGVLTGRLQTREDENQQLLDKVIEVTKQLENCREQLTTNTVELDMLRSAPKQDAQLQSKIQELESEKATLQTQVGSPMQ